MGLVGEIVESALDIRSSGQDRGNGQQTVWTVVSNRGFRAPIVRIRWLLTACFQSFLTQVTLSSAPSA